MDEMIAWIESHPQSVGLIQWVLIAAVAWATGAVRWATIKLRSPKLEVVPQASFVFIENLGEYQGNENSCRACFAIHASIINRSSETIVIDRFKLGYQSYNFIRSMRQRLLRQAFPAWPRKRLGDGYKLMGAYFTKYGDDLDSTLFVSGTIPNRDIASGYLLFVSATHGSWNPKVRNMELKIKLACKLTTGETLYSRASLRIIPDASHVEEFCPGLISHIQNESTWNHTIN